MILRDVASESDRVPDEKVEKAKGSKRSDSRKSFKSTPRDATSRGKGTLPSLR
jgi:hypothetical protein